MFAIRDDRYGLVAFHLMRRVLRTHTFSSLQGIYPAGRPHKGSKEGRRGEEARE